MNTIAWSQMSHIVCKILVNDRKNTSVIRKDGNRDSEAKTHEKSL